MEFFESRRFWGNDKANKALSQKRREILCCLLFSPNSDLKDFLVFHSSSWGGACAFTNFPLALDVSNNKWMLDRLFLEAKNLLKPIAFAVLDFLDIQEKLFVSKHINQCLIFFYHNNIIFISHFSVDTETLHPTDGKI
jgi:hypothetical protein